MRCADADLPIPPVKIGAMIMVLRQLPVNINVLDAVSGSCWNALALSLAAAKTLIVLTFRSLVKSATEIFKGSEPSFLVPLAA